MQEIYNIDIRLFPNFYLTCFYIDLNWFETFSERHIIFLERLFKENSYELYLITGMYCKTSVFFASELKVKLKVCAFQATAAKSLLQSFVKLKKVCLSVQTSENGPKMGTFSERDQASEIDGTLHWLLRRQLNSSHLVCESPITVIFASNGSKWSIFWYSLRRSAPRRLKGWNPQIIDQIRRAQILWFLVHPSN